MKKRYILISLIFMFFAILLINTKTYAQDLDEIVNYVVTVEPRMNDGTLDIIYEITWKVLDSTTEGPLEWVSIGTPNSNFDTPTALSTNINRITKYNGSYVKIVFDRPYTQGEQVTFKYSIHQPYMYKISWGNCKYEFTPAWFTDAIVDNLTIKWNSDKVKKSNNDSKEGNYLVWNKKNMPKGSKLTAEVKYKTSAFTSISTYRQSKENRGNIGIGGIIFILIIVVIIIVTIGGGGGGYYGHRGFYGGGFFGSGFYGGCARSSCACAHSSCASSCACACAGSGRAGCSRKDFYGTNLKSEKLKKAIKKS